jgi:DNA-binding SARP family transcriptional activator/predicted negative regulator of RcsB-dependent stress response
MPAPLEPTLDAVIASGNGHAWMRKMEFRILGPLEVRVGGLVVSLGGRKQRGLLAILLIRANEVVSIDRLIDDLWGEEPPITAQNTIQVYVSQLRKALEGSGPRGRTKGSRFLLTKEPGYLIQASDDHLDARRFEKLAAEGRRALLARDPVAAADRFQEALAQWRGPALADFAFEPFAQVEAERLEELRLATLEHRLQADLELGRHRELVSELESLAAEHPLREQLRSDLMLALYRSGRQADALEVYRATHQTLAEELGVEPTPALQALHQAVLRHDSSLTPARLSPEAEAMVDERSSVTLRETLPLTRSRRDVTILAVRLSYEEPRDDSEPLSSDEEHLLEEVAQTIQQHGGTVDRTLGGTASLLLGLFGVPTLREDDALRAVQAAWHVRDNLPASETTVTATVRIGVATGKVIVEDASLPSGEPIHIALRLAQNALAGEIHVGISTHRLVRRNIVVEPTAKAEGLRLVRLATHAARPATPFVDREAELKVLQQASERLGEMSSPHLLTIMGTAGVGKSRLVREFIVRLEGRVRILQGRCLPYGEGITFWPVAEIVRAAAGITDRDSRKRAIQKVTSQLRHDRGAHRTANVVAQAIGLADNVSAPEETSWAIRRFLEVTADDGPLIVLVDDLHWAEPPLLELIDYITDLSQIPLLLLCLTRPELLETQPNWGAGKLNSMSILLEPLSDEPRDALIRTLLGGDPDESTRRTIAEAAGGNPLFLEETLSYLLEEGHLREVGGYWTGPEGAWLPLPPTLDAILGARIERLPPSERAAIEAAAVVGKEFSGPALAALAGSALVTGPNEPLASLVRKQLIRRVPSRRESAEEFTFRHILIRDAAYATLPPDRLAKLHEVFGDWLERDAGERVAEYEEIIGYHFEQAHRYRQELGDAGAEVEALAHRAGELLAAAGRRALGRVDVGAAANLLARAASFLPPAARGVLLPDLAHAQREAGDLSGADASLQEAMHVAEKTKDEALATRAGLAVSFVRLMAGSVSMEECLREAEGAVEVFDRLSNESGLALAWHDIGRTLLWLGRANEAERALERSARYARRVGDEQLVSESLGWLCMAIPNGPRPISDVIRRLEEIRHGSESKTVEAQALFELASAKAQQGRFDEARKDLQASDSLLEELGQQLLRAALHPLAEVELLAGNPQGAIERLGPRAEELRRMGEKSYLSTSAAWLAQANYELGHYVEASELAEESERSAAPDDLESQIRWRGVRAKLLARRGSTEQAEDLAREAVRMTLITNNLNWHGSALLELADVLTVGDRPEEAKDVLREAVDTLDRKGSTVMANRARTRLKKLVPTHDRRYEG